MDRRIIAVAVTIASAGCSASPASTHVEVLAGIRAVAPGTAWDLETRAFHAVSNEVLAANGFRMIVTPISDRSVGEVPLMEATAPNESFFGMNHEDAEHQRKAAKKRADAAIAQLELRTHASRRTEIINGIVGAVDRFDADHRYTHRLLIILTTGFEQSSIVNTGDYDLKLNAPAVRQRLIDHLKATGQIVDLRATDVCMIGTTNGDGNWADYNRMRGLRQFWNDYFAAGGATYIGIGPTAESCAPITQAQAART